jgi:hypothetical protein
MGSHSQATSNGNSSLTISLIKTCDLSFDDELTTVLSCRFYFYY